MHVELVNGSPRTNGSTSAALMEVEKILLEVDRYCMPEIRSTVELKNAALGDDSVLFGALALMEESA